MSWSIAFIGSPTNVKRTIEQQRFSDPASAAEFEEAKPFLLGIVALNTDDGSAIRIEASGHAYTAEGRRRSYCSINVQGVGKLA